jgi:anti-sigma regulatory factor (Ser/Thr protein kinase)
MRASPISELTHVAAVRREAQALAQAGGLDEQAAGRLAIVVTELATNQLKHARHGEILIGSYADATGAGVEVLALDRGPGIRRLQESLLDGFSTAGSPGQGLGALRRQSDHFELATWPDRGLAVLCRIAGPGPRPSAPASRFTWSGISIPLAGEEACGDAFGVRCQDDKLMALVADGLGHGPIAAVASTAAVRRFAQLNGAPPDEAMRALHEALRPTRGAALGLLRIETGGAQYAGVGNISGAILRPDGISRLVSVAGTAGLTQTRFRTFSYPAGPGALAILASDGISTTWRLEEYPGLAEAHPSLIAAVLFRDFARRRDDATVLVIRVEAP